MSESGAAHSNAASRLLLLDVTATLVGRIPCPSLSPQAAISVSVSSVPMPVLFRPGNTLKWINASVILPSFTPSSAIHPDSGRNRFGLLCATCFLSHLASYPSVTFGKPTAACLLLAVDTSNTLQR